MSAPVKDTAAIDAIDAGRELGEIMEIANDAVHLKVLVNVTTDMAVDAVGSLSPGASPSDRAAIENLVSMLWIARDLTARLAYQLDIETTHLAAQRKAVA